MLPIGELVNCLPNLLLVEFAGIEWTDDGPVPFLALERHRLSSFGSALTPCAFHSFSQSSDAETTHLSGSQGIVRRNILPLALAAQI